MNEPRQLQFAKIGATGCQLLAMVHNAELEAGSYVDAYLSYLNALKLGFIRDDCYVLDHDNLMHILTGKPWKSTLESPSYVAQPGEREVQYWEWQENAATLHTHFVCPDFDPYGASLTVKNGHMVSKRIYRKIA